MTNILRFTAFLFLSISLNSFGALSGRDLDGDLTTFEAYYDDVLDITWLADANYAQTSGHDADGRMNWPDANAWADSLTLGGYTDWRLPNTVDVGNDGITGTNTYAGVDAGYNQTVHSEMSHMFYETLGNIAAFDTSGSDTGCGPVCATNTGPFSNLQNYNYWSATTAPGGYGPNAWVFDFRRGLQTYNTRNPFRNNAWAVHTGDVGAVPLPAAAWLFGSALIGLLAAKRKS